MITALLLTMAVNGYGDTTTITCNFPSEDADEAAIHVVLEPRPSLKDQPGLYRVMIDLGPRGSLKAAAQPILATEERDILIRGTTKRKSMYSIGLREDGSAAFNVQQLDQADAAKTTRIGACRGHEAHIDRWLSMW